MNPGGATYQQMIAAADHIFAGLFGGGAYVYRSTFRFERDLIPAITATSHLLPAEIQAKAVDVPHYDLLTTQTLAPRDDFAALPASAIQLVDDLETAYSEHMQTKIDQSASIKAGESEKRDDLNTMANAEGKRLGNLHRRIAHQRADWLHKLSTELADQHPVIAIEDLKVKAMTASAAGTTEKPGKNVKAKSGLNRSILDAAWSEFARQLDYKLQARGGALIKVPAAYTSQACSACGHTEKLNRESQARFKCVACGHAENADVNAAKNILAAGHAVWARRNLEPAACGGAVRRRRTFRSSGAASKKQEPTEAWGSP